MFEVEPLLAVCCSTLAVYGLALQMLYLFNNTSIIPSTVQLPFLDIER
jgi:hypothetical protein